jgi:xanthine dehydrogenase YagS FAD-binding subunit
MKSFELHDATTVGDAVAMLSDFGPTSKALGGGSDLVGGIMKDWIDGSGMPLPEYLIDVTTIDELHGISRIADGGLRIGAATTLSDIEESTDVQQDWPVLTASIKSIASQLIRNFATIGGNINQRPRCWFMRNRHMDCYKKGGDFCFAVTGDNRYHAIIDGELCYIVHPSDMASSLLALNASSTIAGPDGTRTVALDDYFVGPRDDVLKETVLQNNELMVDVQIPAMAPNTKTAWIKIKDRQVYDFAVVSVAAVVTSENGVWKDGRIVIGGVAPVPYRALVVEEALQDKDIASNIETAAALIASVARPLSNNDFKVGMTKTLIERAVMSTLA